MTIASKKLAIAFQPLTPQNIESIYAIFKEYEPFYQLPQEYFRRGTLGDEGFDPDFALVAINEDTNTIVGFFIAVRRKTALYLKACLVIPTHRYQGIGSQMMQELLTRAKHKMPRWSQIRFGDCPPRYWTPGVDRRHTSLLFFLEKHGFKKRGTRQNLTVDLAQFNQQPMAEKNSYRFERIRPEEKELLRQFVTSEFHAGWAHEALMGLENTPPTAFIAKNSKGELVGFAACDQQFPGSFGPTGVSRSLRGAGIGGELLRWCLYSQKQQGVEETTIQWVGPVKYYSKTANAYLSQQFTIMTRRI